MRPRGIGLIVTLALGILVTPLAAEAQQAGKVWRIGYLTSGSNIPDAFRQGLRELGWVEGQNIMIEGRFAELKLDRLPALAADLVGLKVEVIVTQTTPAAIAAKQATSIVPIVMATAGDVVGSGLVASLARPEGNVTGLSFLGTELAAKNLQLLKEAAPRVSRVAVLWNPDIRPEALALKAMEDVAPALSVSVQPVAVRRAEEFGVAFDMVTRQRADALTAFESALITAPTSRRLILDFAAGNRLPTIFGSKFFAEDGALLAYGINFPALLKRAAYYVDKILKGAKPADLPVEQPTKFELLINLKTAKALGLTIPQSVLIRANQVIQ